MMPVISEVIQIVEFRSDFEIEISQIECSFVLHVIHLFSAVLQDPFASDDWQFANELAKTDSGVTLAMTKIGHCTVS